MLDLLPSPSRSMRAKGRLSTVSSPPTTPASTRPQGAAPDDTSLPGSDVDAVASGEQPPVAMLSPPYTPDRRRSLNSIASFTFRALVPAKFKPKPATREQTAPLTPDPSPARHTRPGNPVCGVSSNDDHGAADPEDDQPLLVVDVSTSSPTSGTPPRSSPPSPSEEAPELSLPPPSLSSPTSRSDTGSTVSHAPITPVKSLSLSSPVSIMSPRIVRSFDGDTQPQRAHTIASRYELDSPIEDLLSPGTEPCTPKLSPSGSAPSPASVCDSVDTPTPRRAPLRRLGSTYSGHFSPQHVLCDDFLAKYSLDSEIGAGGYGFVLTARMRETDEEVAIKFVRKAQLGPDQWTLDSRARRVPLEVYLLRTLDHPGVIACLDVYEDEIYFYMVLELHGSPWSKQRSPRVIEGGDDDDRKLAEYPNLDHVDGEWQSLHGDRAPTQVELPEDLKLSPQLNVRRPGLYYRRPSQDLFECIEHNPLSEDEAKYVFAQVVDAVRYLHHNGIVHRDIKDENILVDHNLRIKLIDFGSAVQEDLSLPAPLYTIFYGTPVYAASEILNHFPFYAAPAEIWTLGILLCNVVWGCSPFVDGEAARVGAVHLPRFTPNARWRESSTSESISSCISLVNWCLHPNPARRPTIDGVANHPWLRDAFPVRAA